MANTGRIPKEIAMVKLTDSYHEFGTDSRDDTAELAARTVPAPNPAALLHVATPGAGTVTDHPRNERYGQPTAEGIDRADVSDGYVECSECETKGYNCRLHDDRRPWLSASNEVSRGAW